MWCVWCYRTMLNCWCAWWSLGRICNVLSCLDVLFIYCMLMFYSVDEMFVDWVHYVDVVNVTVLFCVCISLLLPSVLAYGCFSPCVFCSWSHCLFRCCLQMYVFCWTSEVISDFLSSFGSYLFLVRVVSEFDLLCSDINFSSCRLMVVSVVSSAWVNGYVCIS